MDVADAMTPREEIVTAELPGTRDAALASLKERQFSSIPVVKQTEDGEDYRGVVRREDLMNHPDEDQLAVLMREVPTVTADTSVVDAGTTMRETGTRQIPVVDEQLTGIMTVTDVVHAIARENVSVDSTAVDMRTDTINTVYKNAPLTVGERALSYADVPYAICLDDDGAMTGILTEVDIIDVARVVEGEDDTGGSVASQDNEWTWEGIKSIGNRYVPTRNVEIPTEPIAMFMSKDIKTVRKQQSIVEVGQMMITNDIEQLPLIEGNSLIGVVRDVNFLEAL